MDQSIASSQGDTNARNRSSKNVVSMLTGLWLAVTSKTSIITSRIWHSRNPMSSNIFERLDVDRISVRLDVENRAESDGQSDQPPSTEEGVSGTQREIVAYFKELQRKAKYRVADLAKKLRELREEIDLSEVGNSLRDIPSRWENEILRLIAESQSQLDYLGEQEAQHKQQYATLLEKSQQNQVAERPIPPAFHWIFLALLIGVGAFAIAKITVSGFGNVTLIPPSWAISIALFVVLASFVIARAVSGAVNLIGHLTGWLGSALGIALIAMMALVAADYIAAATMDPGVTVRTVVDSIVADPRAIFTDVADWKSLGIVFSVGLLAFLVSYQTGNSSPGQGRIQSAIHRTRNQRNRLTKRLRMQINAMIDQADAEATDLLKRPKKQISQFSRWVDESKRIPARLSDYDVALEDGCNILLDRYRLANTSARKSDVPAGFSEHVCFRPEHEPSFITLGEKEGRLEALQESMSELEIEATEIRKKLRELNSLAISTLEDTPSSN